MKMKSVYCYMLAGLMLSASSCSSWLSEDDAPVMSYDYYETEDGSLRFSSLGSWW